MLYERISISCSQSAFNISVLSAYTTDADKSSRRILPEVLSTMTSQQRCHDNCRRRRAAVHGAETRIVESCPTSSAVRYPITAVDDRSTTTGSSCSEPGHVIPGHDDVTRQSELTVHRRRRRTAFTSDQVSLAAPRVASHYPCSRAVSLSTDRVHGSCGTAPMNTAREHGFKAVVPC